MKRSRLLYVPERYDPPQPLDGIHSVPGGEECTRRKSVALWKREIVQLEGDETFRLCTFLERHNLTVRPNRSIRKQPPRIRAFEHQERSGIRWPRKLEKRRYRNALPLPVPNGRPSRSISGTFENGSNFPARHFDEVAEAHIQFALYASFNSQTPGGK